MAAKSNRDPGDETLPVRVCQARAVHRLGDDAKAIKHLEAADDLESGADPFLKAMALWRSDKHDETREAYAGAMKTEPTALAAGLATVAKQTTTPETSVNGSPRKMQLPKTEQKSRFQAEAKKLLGIVADAVSSESQWGGNP